MSPSRKTGSRSKPAARRKAKKPVRAAKKKVTKKKKAARKAASKKSAGKAAKKRTAKKKTLRKKPSTKKKVGKATTGKKKRSARSTAKARTTSKKKTARKKAPRKTATPAGGPDAGATVVRTEPKVSTVQRNTESWEKARKAYSHAMKLVQQHHWRQAAQALSDFLAEHGRERELCQRARTYLRVASSQMGADESTPETVEDHCLQATVLANDGKLKDAVRMLDAALKRQPDSDKALYLKASTLALMRDRRASLAALARAIELNDQNRIWAANNPDFTDLRDDEEFITLTTREDEES